MFQPRLPETEIMYRQEKLRGDFIRAQRQVSVIGLRQIIGSTIIEMGGRIHGVAKASCPDSDEAGASVLGSVGTSSPSGVGA